MKKYIRLIPYPTHLMESDDIIALAEQTKEQENTKEDK